MKSIKAILFDLDGTLLDTLADIGDSVNRVLREKGFPVHPLKAFKQFVGDGVQILIQRSLPEEKRDVKIINECLWAFMLDYRQNWHVKTKAYEGIFDMLNVLTDRKIKLTILSNKPHEFTILCVQRILGKWDFNIILGARDAAPRKPDPAGALEIVGSLKLRPSDFLFLGDTGVDMKTAVNAGMYPVGALWGFRTRDELIKNGAQATIEHPLDICDLLQN